MPLYLYVCEQGHETELLRQRDAATAACPCGATAARQSVYRTAVIGQAEVPRDERSYRRSYSEYQDAVADVAHHYERRRADGDPVREPDYFSLAKAQAAAKGAQIRG